MTAPEPPVPPPEGWRVVAYHVGPAPLGREDYAWGATATHASGLLAASCSGATEAEAVRKAVAMAREMAGKMEGKT